MGFELESSNATMETWQVMTVAMRNASSRQDTHAMTAVLAMRRYAETASERLRNNAMTPPTKRWTCPSTAVTDAWRNRTVQVVAASRPAATVSVSRTRHATMAISSMAMVAPLTAG